MPLIIKRSTLFTCAFASIAASLLRSLSVIPFIFKLIDLLRLLIVEGTYSTLFTNKCSILLTLA